MDCPAKFFATREDSYDGTLCFGKERLTFGTISNQNMVSIPLANFTGSPIVFVLT
jgi:hypothetical protein